MNIPKWLASVWIAAIVVASIAFAQWTPTVGQQASEGFMISGVFLFATCVTAVWALWKQPAMRVYVILWAVALFVADALSHLKPAAAGVKSSVATVGPPAALAVAAAIILTVWAVRKFHKPRAA